MGVSKVPALPGDANGPGAAARPPAELAVRDLRVSYGPVAAVRGITLTARAGEIQVILGANGAGKSSLLNAISGLAPVKSGSIALDDRELRRVPPHRIARMGVIQVPEGRQVAAPLTTQENLQLGALARGGRDSLPERFGTLEAIYELFPSLYQRRSVPAGQLSGGEQQMLALGRALMGAPRVMLLDEPSMGLAPKLVDTVMECISKIGQTGITVLMVEQNIAALDISKYAFLMNLGSIVYEGPATDVASNDLVADAYLGPGAGPESAGAAGSA